MSPVNRTILGKLCRGKGAVIPAGMQVCAQRRIVVSATVGEWLPLGTQDLALNVIKVTSDWVLFREAVSNRHNQRRIKAFLSGRRMLCQTGPPSSLRPE